MPVGASVGDHDGDNVGANVGESDGKSVGYQVLGIMKIHTARELAVQVG